MDEQLQATTPRQDTYAPYRKEAFYCLIIDTVIAISLTLLLLLAGAGWFLLIILPLFAALTVLINYRTALRARREVREEAFETATLTLTDVREDRSASGYGGAILRELYPKSLHAGRCRIVCRDKGGEKILLFCVMSEEKRRLIREAIDRGHMEQVTLTYGARSHILVCFENSGSLMNTLNQKF